MKTIQQIHDEATDAAVRAAAQAQQRFGDGFPCGFAWVSIYDVNLGSKVGKEFKRLGFTKGYGRRTPIELWNPSHSPVQNIDIKEAGARAYAEVFSRHGFKAYPNSRLD
jgi:hypothetical protein